MTARILDGRALSQRIKDDLKEEVAKLKGLYGNMPSMVNIIAGNYHCACAYANAQKKAAEYIGVGYELVHLPEDATQEEIVKYIEKVNGNSNIHGIILHKPVPEHINYRFIADHIAPEKDLEGINVNNIGKLILGKQGIMPCTPASVMEHIRLSGIDIRGKEAVVIGHSEIVGKPLSLLLLREFATVTVCHIATSEAGMLTRHINRADILVSAVGKPSFIKGEWIKEGAVVIDVGINRIASKIVGDIEFETACRRASYITPVPGGVGPVTVVMLMRNLINAFKEQV